MKLHDIGNRLLSLMKTMLQVLKDVFKLPYIKTYIGVSFLLIILFIIITFPYDILLRNQLQKFEPALFKSIYIRDIQTSLIDITSVKNIHIIVKDEDEITVNEATMNMAINPYTVFFKKILKGDLAVNGFRYASKDVQFDMNINGNIDLQMDNKFNNIVNGKIKFIIQNGNLKLTELNVPTPLGNIPITIPDLKISTINVDSIINNRNLKIENFVIMGPDLKATISGTITIANIFSNSAMNVIVLIDPQSKLISNYKELLTSFTDKDGKIKLPLKGTIQHPKLEGVAVPDSSQKAGMKNEQLNRKPGIVKTNEVEANE